MLSIQFRKCSETGRFMSFGAALSLLVRDELLKIMLVVGASQLVQSTLLGYDSGIGSASPISSRSFGLIYPPPLVMHLLLGQSHFSFVLLDWLLLLVSIGWLVLVFVLLQLVVSTIASVWIRFGLSAHLKKHNNNTTTRWVFLFSACVGSNWWQMIAYSSWSPPTYINLFGWCLKWYVNGLFHFRDLDELGDLDYILCSISFRFTRPYSHPTCQHSAKLFILLKG
jgi:hypothetical protein